MAVKTGKLRWSYKLELGVIMQVRNLESERKRSKFIVDLRQ